MSAIGDVMAGLKTAMQLTGKVDRLDQSLERLGAKVEGIDRRLIRVETIIEITRADGATLRIARPDEQ